MKSAVNLNACDLTKSSGVSQVREFPCAQRVSVSGTRKTVKVIPATHEFPYNERYTLLEIYCELLSPKFANFVVKKYAKDLRCRAKAAFDIVELRTGYENLAKEVGDFDMSRLNEAVANLFIIYPVMKSYLQLIANNYLFCLLYRDSETSKRVFQLLTDKNSF